MNTYGIEKYGIINSKAVYRNLTPAQLVEAALRREEGTLSNTGALVVKTGKYTGRSANDKFIVDTPAVHDDIAWGKVNRPISKENFYAIYDKVVAYLQNKEVFIFDGFAGADPKYTKSFRIIADHMRTATFIIGDDPTYQVIDGAWLSDAPYAAIHRVAGDGLTRGVFHECVEYAKARWASLRIDTHRDNLPMQRHILREGFVYCGVIRTRDGTERLAYQWDAPCRREKQA